MNRPLFSITTPSFNSAQTIERTLKSILGQDWKDYEYIIVDGGSTDGTLDIIRRYEPLFEGRMHWQSEPDDGLYDAFNKGVSRSRGIYCWNINSDDYIEPNSLSFLAQVIQNFKEDRLPIIVGGLNVRDFDGSFLYDYHPTMETVRLAYRKDFMIPHPATLVPKAIYDLYGGFDTRFKICGDKDWFHRVYKKGVPFFVVTDVILSNFVRGGISNSSSYCSQASDHWLLLKNKYDSIIIRVFRFLIWNYYHTKGYILRRIKNR